jgi:acetyl-CoA carboxylase biotin carboxyl carrier protein
MSDLTPDDVREILRLVDEAGVDDFELETPRLSIRVRRSDPQAPSEDLLLGEGLVDVTAPSVGTFYRSPAPGEPPFVEVGSAVTAGTQVCILEVMKLMNAVTAGVDGVVAEVCIANGAAVQFGDVLFRVRPA